MQTWVDALTVKTFNEELTDVFPYLYRLVKEKQDRGLTYDDLVSEAADCDTCHKDPCDCDVEESSDMFDEFESQVDELATPGFEQQMDEEPNEGNEFANIVQKLKAQGAKPGTKFKTSDGEEHTLKDAIEMSGMTVEDFWTGEELAEMQAEQQVIPQEVVEFIASMYDHNTGTFPRGEEGVKIACEKKFGDQAGQFANYVVEKLSMKGEGKYGAAVGSALGGMAGAAVGAVGGPVGAAVGKAVGSVAGKDIGGSITGDDEDDMNNKNESNIKGFDTGESVNPELVRIKELMKY
jgi:hypothetical protein